MMKHEKFEVFTNLKDMNEYLGETLIHPKSISVSNDHDRQYFFIGYSETKKEHHYQVEKFELKISEINLLAILHLVEDEAKKHGGVICQDIALHDGHLVVHFLTAK